MRRNSYRWSLRCLIVALVGAAALSVWVGAADAQAGVDREPFAAVVVPARVEAEHFDSGLEGEVFADTDGSFGNRRTDSKVDVWEFDEPWDGASGSLIGRTRDGEFTEYTVTVAEAGLFEIRLSVASGAEAPGVIDVDVDGSRLGTVSGDTDRWFDWTTRSVGSTQLPEGDHVIRLTWSRGANVNLDWFELVSVGPTEPTCASGRQEAEDAVVAGRFRTVASDDASGGAFVDVPRGSQGWLNGVSDSFVEFCFGAATSGRYRLDAGLRAPTQRDNSFYVAVDNGPLVDFVAEVGTEFFTASVNDAAALDPVKPGDAEEPIVEPVEWDLDAGDHTVRFYLRRDGTELDHVALIPLDTDPAPTPTPPTPGPEVVGVVILRDSTTGRVLASTGESGGRGTTTIEAAGEVAGRARWQVVQSDGASGQCTLRSSWNEPNVGPAPTPSSCFALRNVSTGEYLDAGPSDAGYAVSTEPVMNGDEYWTASFSDPAAGEDRASDEVTLSSVAFGRELTVGGSPPTGFTSAGSGTSWLVEATSASCGSAAPLMIDSHRDGQTVDVTEEGLGTGSFLLAGVAPSDVDEVRVSIGGIEATAEIDSAACETAWSIRLYPPGSEDVTIAVSAGDATTEVQLGVQAPIDDDPESGGILVEPRFGETPQFHDLLVSYEADAGELVFAGDVSDDIDVGDGVGSGPSDIAPDGYLRIVESIAYNGTTTVVRGRQAALDEYIVQISFAAMTRAPEPIRIRGESTPEIEPSQGALAAPGALGPGDVEANFEVDPSASFNFKVTRKSCRWFLCVPRGFDLGVEVGIDVSASATITHEFGALDTGRRLIGPRFDDYSLGSVTIPTPIPIRIKFEAETQAFYQLELSAALSFEVASSIGGIAGFEHKDDGSGRGWYRNFDANGGRPLVQPDLDLGVTGTATIGIEIDIEALLYGQAGIEIEATPQLVLSLTVDRVDEVVKWNLSLAVPIGGGFEIEIDIRVWTYEREFPGPALVTLSINLFDGEIPLNSDPDPPEPPDPDPPDLPTCADCDEAGSVGDPHLVTFDGVAFDLQTVGEFVSYRSEDGAIEVHVRHAPWAGSRRVSVNSAVAARVNDRRVMFEPGSLGGRVRVDGEDVEMDIGSFVDLGDGATIVRTSPIRYTVAWPTADDNRPRLDVNLYGTHINLYPRLPEATRGTISGLLGNQNGIAADDFVLPDGTVLEQPFGFDILNRVFAESWRITDETSLFDYDPGESTASFTDRSFPVAIVRINDFEPASVAEAEAVCRAAGVINQLLLDACVLDLLVTGSDEFVDGAVDVVEPASTIPVTIYQADFDDGDSPNWVDAIVNEISGAPGEPTRRFVGPATGSTASLQLTDVPPHSDITVAFDLIIRGAWTGDGVPGRPDTFSLSDSVAGRVFSATFSNTDARQSYPQAGSVAQSDAIEVGDDLSIYRIEVNYPRWQSGLMLSFSASGPSAVRADAWGIDNVAVLITPVIPEVLGYELGSTGASTIDAPRDESRHIFSIPAGGVSASWTWGDCFDDLTAQLFGPTGEPMSGLFGCRDVYLQLDEGDYSMSVSTEGTGVGAYSFRVDEADEVPIVDYAAAILDDQPVLYQRFESDDGADAVGGAPMVYRPDTVFGVPGALTSAPRSTAARVAEDAAGQPLGTLDSAGLPAGNSPRTIEFWFRRRPLVSGFGWMVRYGSDVGIRYAGDALWASGEQRPGAGDDVGFTWDRPPLIDGDWHHFAMTYDGAIATLYLDGAIVGSAPASWRSSADGSLTVGEFAGSYDELAVYDTALSAEQISQHYAIGATQTGTPCVEPATDLYGASVLSDNPVGYYRFGDRTPGGNLAAVAYDSSPACRNGAFRSESTAAGPPGASDGASLVGPATVANPYVALASPDALPFGNASRSVEFWYRGSEQSPGPRRNYIEYGIGIERVTVGSVDVGRGVQVAIGDVTVQTLVPLEIDLVDGEWHHLVMTYDAEAPLLNLYIDGVQIGSAAISPGDAPAAAPARPTVYIGRVQGDYAEVAIYAEALGPDRIAEHYALGSGPAP